MALLLRTVRYNKWFRTEAEAFLANGDVPADPVSDLATTQNLLSVYVVEDDVEHFERVVSAIASTRDHLQPVGYIVFDSKHLEEYGIEIKEVTGATDDAETNRRHRDLVLSGKKLVGLTRTMLAYGKSDQILKKHLEQLCRDGVREKRLPEAVLMKFKLES